MSDKPLSHTAHFKTRVGFILAAVGLAVGLGNIWRFPYLVGTNGGALFVFIYLFFVVLLGLPLILTEITFGRYARANQVRGFSIAGFPKWRFVGIWALIGQFLILFYYPVVAGWSMHYFFAEIDGSFTNLTDKVQFSHYFDSLINSYGSSILWAVVFILLSSFIIGRGVQKGVERLSLYAMPLLFAILVFLDIWTMTIPGALKGLEFYFKPDLATFSWRSVLAALGQSGFSIGVGYGIMYSYGAFIPSETRIFSSSILIALLDTLVALLAALIVIPAVFAFGFNPQAGAGLTFITLPVIFSTLPMGHLFGALFFFLLFIAAITSSVAIAIASLYTLQAKCRRATALLIITILYILGATIVAYSLGPWSGFKIAGKGLFNWADYIAGSIIIPIGMMLYAIFMGWFGWDKISPEIKLHPVLRLIWKWLLRIFVPVLVAIVFVAGLLA